MKDIETEKVKKIYSNLFKKNKDSYLSLNWGSKESQYLRFKVLSYIDKLENKSILDVGCGLGDFYLWLNKNMINTDYLGIDITETFIKSAINKYGKDLFVCDNFLLDDVFKNKTFDYVFASGIFATYTKEPISIYKKYITRMWDLANEGVGFNSLSSWTNEKDDSEYYADPNEIINLCRKFTNKIVLKHNYHPRDFTIFLYR